MASKREKTRYPGVYERAIVSRTTGKPDVAYDINFRANGKLVWMVAGTRQEHCSAATAARFRANQINAVEQGAALPGKSLTFDQAWKMYLEQHLVGKSNLATDSGFYVKHLKEPFGAKPLNKITTIDILNFKNKLETTPKPFQPTKSKKKLKEQEEAEPSFYAPQTVKNIIGLITRIYRRCIAWKVYSGPVPTDGVQLQKPDNRRERYLTPEEAKSLLEALKPRSRTLYEISAVSLFTGMRQDEIFTLKAHHIDVEAGIVYAMDAKAGSRPVHMAEQVKDIFKQRLKECPEPNSPVFPNSDGKHMRELPDQFTRLVNKMFNEGITDARHRVVFHTLRHTFGSWLAQRQVSLYTIAELMGHATITMTQRYAKLSPDVHREAIKKLNDNII